jgi:ketosteroid isomerase-like protein
MSQDNVEAVKRAVDAYNRRDVEALLEELDAEIEWYSGLPMVMSGNSTVYRGHEGIRELFREFDELFAEIHAEYTEIQDLGDRILAIGAIRMRGRESGAATESPLATVSDFRDGRAIRITSYLDPQAARDEVGLGE